MSDAHKEGARKRMAKFKTPEAFSKHMSDIAKRQTDGLSPRQLKARAKKLVEARRAKRALAQTQ